MAKKVDENEMDEGKGCWRPWLKGHPDLNNGAEVNRLVSSTESGS